MRESGRYHRQQGFALVLVLWLVALLTIVAASFSTHSKVETRLAGNAIDALHTRLLAQSGLNRAILELMVSNPEQRWNRNGQIYQIATDRGSASISIRNASGLLDLNKAPREQLAKLFALLEDDIEAREALADRLMDWRDSDDLRRLDGAEDVDYRSAGYPYGTAGRDLVNIDELAYVMGFNADRVERLRPYVTLYSSVQNVDMRYAPEVLISLLEGVWTSSETLSDVLDYVDSDLAEIELDEGRGQAAGADYRIWVEAVSAQAARTQFLVDIELRPGGDAPYSIRSWHDSL
ncbi:MAG: PilX N-terminal domain-containing pilus assembly protein [Candidatus Thiodiazotropha sp.]